MCGHIPDLVHHESVFVSLLSEGKNLGEFLWIYMLQCVPSCVLQQKYVQYQFKPSVCTSSEGYCVSLRRLVTTIYSMTHNNLAYLDWILKVLMHSLTYNAIACIRARANM